jgi:hypothetical protein
MSVGHGREERRGGGTLVAHLLSKMRSIASSFQSSGMLLARHRRGSSLALDPLPFAFDVTRRDALRNVCIAVLVGPFPIARPALLTDQTVRQSRAPGSWGTSGEGLARLSVQTVETKSVAKHEKIRNWLSKTSEISPSGCREQIFSVY